MTKYEDDITKFQAFPKIGRVFKHTMIITEKIDGTNAQVVIEDVTDVNPEFFDTTNVVSTVFKDERLYFVYAGSRNRYITPEKDNYGFASWVKANAEELVKLGPGRHFGEWWGKGIQRGYGLTEKRFSLFNTGRWSNPEQRPACCSVVPVLKVHSFDTEVIKQTLEELKQTGSKASPGFMDVEGIVVFHTASNTLWKYTVDDNHKGNLDNEQLNPEAQAA